MKDPNSWVDVFGLDCGSDAKKLRQNMLASGMEKPDFANSAHHIVMSSASQKTNPKMFVLREKMKNFGININDADIRPLREIYLKKSFIFASCFTMI